jgi:lysophospholipase L1-like esterase
MKALRSLASSALALALFAAPLWAQAPAPKAPPPPPQKPNVPAPKLGPDGQPNPAFLRAHESFVKIAKEGRTQLLFLGDSITAGWARQTNIWNTAFGKYHPANFGIGGDRTQHVLWRIQNGELDGIKPRVAVLMIGTNNSGSDSAEGIADGIKEIIKTLHARSPQTKVLLLAVFPRGDRPDGKFGAAQEKLKKVNSIISKMHDGKRVFYLDIGEKFLVNGAMSAEIMPDFLHLSPKGYQIWADAITPHLAELMK